MVRFSQLGQLKANFCSVSRASARAGFPRVAIRPGLSFTFKLGKPPAQADEQKTPVFEKFGGLAFEIMSDKLEDPAGDK